MIPVICITYEPAFKDVKWPTRLYAVPRVGEIVCAEEPATVEFQYRLEDNSGYETNVITLAEPMLHVYSVKHKTTHIEITLHMKKI